MRIDKVVETADRFLLVVGWDTVAAHLDGFKGSEDWEQWRRLVGPYLAKTPDVLQSSQARTFF